MSTPVEKLAATQIHLCQACGQNRADIAVVNLLTAETDIQCYPCHVAMMTAVIAEVAATATAEGGLPGDSGVETAMEAARAALADS